ncbi:GFA family protein [Nitrococcus mobilis]|uniref:CENP-V/GFA domain-containing protein n=1 Tax=Nitrococcus mobilis Nb-231 TaxID=314278 RepID=A4BT01_9GAMM|nr:GFA family protein [Nitrococcus mobilis]EAR21069.1 hypothetical protein NB231_07862 [Nitrococcus mobilis Nb-231]
MTAIEISCLCGAVKVRINGEPLVQFYCHCDDCQAVHGGAYIGVAIYPSQAVAVTQGELVSWTLKSLPRQRCAICGTPMIARVLGLGGCGVLAHRLPKGMFKPEFHIQCQHALLPIKDDLPHFAAFPARFGGVDDTVEW